MIILVWYGMACYGMAWYGTRRWDPRALWVPRAAPRAIPCHTIPCHAIPYQDYHILILLHYYLIIYDHLVILLYVLYCIIFTSFWICFWILFGSFWDIRLNRVSILLRSFWDHFGMMVASFVHYVLMIRASCLDDFSIFWMILTSFFKFC